MNRRSLLSERPDTSEQSGNPNAKVAPRALLPTPGQLPKPRRGGGALGAGLMFRVNLSGGLLIAVSS